jgi:hypothetical protein
MEKVKSETSVVRHIIHYAHFRGHLRLYQLAFTLSLDIERQCNFEQQSQTPPSTPHILVDIFNIYSEIFAQAGMVFSTSSACRSIHHGKYGAAKQF